MYKQKYLIVIERATGNLCAYAPDVPGCIATGNTIERTIAEMQNALQFHLENMQDAVPQPKGLAYYVTAGELKLSDNELITEVEVHVFGLDGD